MKKILVSQLIQGQMSNNNFADNLASAVATDASGENLLVYLTVGIPERISLVKENTGKLEEKILGNHTSWKSVKVIDISTIDIPQNRISVHYEGVTTRYFKDQASVKDGNQYSGSSRATEDYPYASDVHFTETEWFDIDTLEEIAAIEVVRCR